MSSFEPSRIPAWLAPVCDERSVSHSVSDVAVLGDPARHLGRVAVAHRALQDRQREPVDLEEDDPRLVGLDLPAGAARDPLRHAQHVASRRRSSGRSGRARPRRPTRRTRRRSAHQNESTVIASGAMSRRELEHRRVEDEHEQEAEHERERQPERRDDRRQDRVQDRDQRRGDERAAPAVDRDARHDRGRDEERARPRSATRRGGAPAGCAGARARGVTSRLLVVHARPARAVRRRAGSRTSTSGRDLGGDARERLGRLAEHAPPRSGGRPAGTCPSGSARRCAAGAASSACAARSRIEVPARHARPPAGDGQQRDVEVARDVAHPVEEIGVAGEPDPQRAADEVAEGGHAHPEDLPAAVLGVRRGDVDAVHVGVVADVELRHVREPAAAKHVAGADRDDDARRAADERAAT